MLLPFLKAFYLSSPGGIATCTALLQFVDSAGNIAANTLVLTNTFSYSIFRIFILFSERFLKVEDCFIQQTQANTNVIMFERVTFSFLFQL
jgi:hypothetical protein